MKNKLIFLSVFTIVFFAVSSSFAAAWPEDFAIAKAQAKKKDVPVLMFFARTGLCTWCELLEKDVFSKPEFKSFASKNLVLVKIDFPKKKQQATKRAKNIKLRSDYRVYSNTANFPQVVLVDSAGNIMGRIRGYPSDLIKKGGAKAYIEEIEKIIKKYKESGAPEDDAGDAPEEAEDDDSDEW